MKSFKRFLNEGIKKRGDKFVVTDSSGDKVLGTHGSRKKALKQLAAVEISKKRLTEQRGAMLAGVLAATPLMAGAAHAQHKVKSGDTLSHLAKQHGITVADLAAHNNIADPNKINVGDKIKFPDKKKTSAPKATPKVAPKSKPISNTKGHCPYGSPNCLYDQIAQAETGSFKNKFIRTVGVPGSSSTAYGPVQITVSSAIDSFKRHPDLYKGQEDYVKSFIAQGEKFRKYGREPNKPGYEKRYDYGGTGDLAVADLKKYKPFAISFFKGKSRDVKADPTTPEGKEKIKEATRGVPRSKDKRWYDETDKVAARQTKKS
tara:strand:+ start:323 stop:1273 length:951 start_codon:yes stop_codon:yes gene_type:complete